MGGAKFTRPGKIMTHPGLNFQMAGYQAQIYEINKED
jgi:hypothetical protein